MKSTKKILFLVPADYDSLKAKNVLHMIFERDEQNFFDKVITVHPLAFRNQRINLNNRHVLYEYDLRKYLYPDKNTWFLFPLLPLRLLLIIRTLSKLIKRENIQLIRATDPYLMGIIAYILSCLTKIPFCVSMHSDYEKRFVLNPKYGLQKFLRYLSKWVRPRVLAKADMIMPIRECYAQQLINNGVPSKCIRVIPHGIDLRFIPVKDLKEQFGLPLDKKIISFVGRIAKDNYIDDILSMLEKMYLIRNDFIVVMVGGGEMEDFIKAWLTNHSNLASAIRFWGFQPNHIGRSLRYISEISLCLMGGFSLIEAAAAGSPIIAYDVEWHYELVENHVTGFLIDEHDINNLVMSVSYLLNNPQEAITMGLRAKQKAFQFHDIDKTTEIKRNCYLEMIQ